MTPFQAGVAALIPFLQPLDGDKLRGKPEKLASHGTQP
ncbi:hypothetical protein AH4AK4_1028 [Aeromonas hydrophila 4AK4]|nr:hypothetical protein AH4AK4_1028 [Aeromonas hydrophila 4AK4]